jgi:hypothetical protein
MKKALILLIYIFSTSFVHATQMLGPSLIKQTIDWQKFMACQDLIWTKLPKAWDEGSFMGNGRMGTLIYKEPDQNSIHIEIGNSDVHDHRYNIPSGNHRLLIGYFSIEPVGKIKGGTMRLNLWNAETIATIETDKGSLNIRSIVHSDEMVAIVEVTSTGYENGFSYKWHPARADSPRELFFIQQKQFEKSDKNYVSNPDPVIDETSDVNTCAQPLDNNWMTVTAWKKIKRGNTNTLYVNVTHGDDGRTKGKAIETITANSRIKLEKLFKSHRQWWNNYYPESFISLPDKKLENFYWIQIYKLASATRSDRCLIDNTGPWLSYPTPWPNAWWNLNVQLAYWPVYTSNRLKLGESLASVIFDHTENLINTVPIDYRYNSAAITGQTGFDCKGDVIGKPGEGEQIGLLPWVCHNLWLQYRYSMDDKMLRTQLYPILKRAINYYLHFLKEENDGHLHLPLTFSPEYGEAADCNFDLALLRWGCQTLMDISNRFAISDSLVPQWKKVLEKLTDYPKNNDGFMIGRNVPYAFSHRHFSHLLMIYPLYLVNTDQKGTREIMQTSFDFWLSKPALLKGYTFTGASSISSALGNGDDALKYLTEFISRFLRPNGLYKEPSGPTTETPLSGAQSINDMLIQSWGDKIRVFPALPSVWKDVVFNNLRTEGAFLVSARRVNGATNFVWVRSLAGEPCIIKTDIKKPVAKIGNKNIILNIMKEGTFKIDLKKNEEVIIYPEGTKVDFIIDKVVSEDTGKNFFGIK